MTGSVRTVITGMGVVAPNGIGTERYWQAARDGRSGIRELSRFDTSGYPYRLAGQIVDFVAEEHIGRRLLPQTDVSTRLALAAADWAIADASGLDGLASDRMGVVTANALGGFEFTHREFRKLWRQGSPYVSVYESFAWFYAVNSGQISIRNGLRGSSAALVAEQAGGLDALGHACRTIRGGTDLMITGGVDSALDPWGFLSQFAGGRVSVEPDPARAYLPFDAAASGYVPGEGGAMLVVESAASAHARGAAQIHAEIAGYAATFDPPPGSGRPSGLRRAAEQAIAGAGLVPGDIGVVFADASGVPELDRDEAATISALFGPGAVPVTAPKALTGRLYAGGGPLDVVTAVLSLRDGVIPPTAHTTAVPESYQIDLVLGAPRELPLPAALVLARGRHGFNAAVVVRAWSQ
ncbi:ketosynthase chain-length factor [Micromonospora endophytica]|uniref:Ketosynthase chain-length factor n=1 Tax=Micromonospora endophytica TaxID=515350 RepID=A0A2W2DVJ5_9ACTN|nr:ketosynthase chain-length factor [Micromonospora endophytica]PZG01217.1 ketosynthase chain-length factor [Micromonospora endophytica]RIW45842.1 ketosynthase chain-length factor [Micromonospora endophytica]